MDTLETPYISESRTKRPLSFAIFGQPVAHSLSPHIHKLFALQLGMMLNYDAIEAHHPDFPAKLSKFMLAGGRGANITLPLKEFAFTLCNSLSEHARRVGSVNTLTRVSGTWRGDNTDGSGLIRDIAERHRLDIRSRRTLLLGAGGAARSVAWSLLDAGIGELIIVNRTPERADALADAIGNPGRVHTRYWEDLATCGSFDCVINATSAGLLNVSLELPASLLAPRALCYDLSYGKAAFGFLAWAKSADAAHTLDGLGMLVEQAADAFEIWHGTRPETADVYTEICAHVASDATD